MWPFTRKPVTRENDRIRELELTVAALRGDLARAKALADDRMEAVFRWQERSHQQELNHGRLQRTIAEKERLLEALRGLAELSYDLAYKGRREEQVHYERAELSGLAAEYESISMARSAVRKLASQLSVETTRSREMASLIRESQKKTEPCPECSCIEVEL